MSEKIGRNDPCPCRSGKKSKKCCFIHSFKPGSKMPRAEYGLLKTYFRSFNEKDLFSTIGALQLIPENDYHAVRLEVAAQIASSIKIFGNKNIDIVDFVQHLNKFLPTLSDIGLKEDPPEHLFTENIPFNNGNIVVYPSIYHEEESILENFFMVINSRHEKFPNAFIDDVMTRSYAILSISNEIARRLNHKRYMDSVHDYTSKREDIKIPENDLLIRYKNAVTFQKKDLVELISPIDGILTPFFLNKTDHNFQENSIDSNPLVISPLIDFGDEFVVLNPISLLCALRHNLILTAKKYHIETEFTNYYREVLWLKSDGNLYLMGYDRIDFSLPPPVISLPVIEGLFRIDTNKISFVQLISDSSENYDKKNPKGIWDTRRLIDQICKRDMEIIKLLKKEWKNDEIFILKIFGHIGREATVKYQNVEKIRTLLISDENLKIVSLSGKCDQLTLWKYVKAESDAYDYYKYFSHSFLDKFSFYEENDTLILKPRLIPNIIPIPPGFGKKHRLNIAQMYDEHQAELGKPDSIFLARVRNAYRDSKIPIYQLIEPAWNYNGYEIEGFFQPFWVFYYQNLSEQDPETFQYSNELIKTIAYWLSQVMPKLKEHLKPLGENPIHIFVRYDNIKKWGTLDPVYFDSISNTGSFDIYFEERAILFGIEDSFLKQLRGPDNSGERILLRGLLKAISNFTIKELGDCSLKEKQINEMVEEFAPLGIKKQFFLFMSGAEGLLLNNNLPPLRLIQYHDIQEQSLGIASQLAKWNFFNPLSHSEKTDVCKAIVKIYINRLKELIKEYRWDDLLKSLIGSFDSVLHNGKKMHVFAPYHESCYPNDSDFIQRMMQDISKIEKTLLCQRTLIEIIIAEPPLGKKITNTDDIDKMLAMVHNMIDWATVADLYYYNLLQSDFEFGVGGRIFKQMEGIDDKYTAFLKEKTQESIQGSYEHYKGEFDYKKNLDRQNKSDLSKEMDTVFLAEFGFDINQISRFFCCLIHSTDLFICPEQVGPVYSLDKNEFKKRIGKSLNWTESKVDRALEEFSLTDRGLWETAPNGFTFEADIAPWKFRRRISHARRPLLVGPEPKENPVIMWGSLNSERCMKYIGELVVEGRYDTTRSTPEMKSFIAKILRIKGDEFTNFIEEWFKKNSTWFIQKNVQIPIRSENNSLLDNFGDIDVLAIDEKSEIIYSIECKNLNFGRNAREMANEIIRLYHGSNGEDSWILKHKNRDKWLKENFEKVIKKFSLIPKQYKVRSFILTSEAIPASFLHEFDPDIPIFSFNQLEREGIDLLQTLFF